MDTKQGNVGLVGKRASVSIGKWFFCLPMLLCATAALAQQTGTVTYVYTDPQGTPLAEADSKGNITATYDYTPYGSIATTGEPPNGPGYTGHVNDPETNLVYMQHRYYDPSTGRFLSPDAAPAVPGELNYVNDYAYVGDNPIARDDPSGNYICASSKSNCGVIRKGLKDIAGAAKKLPAGSKGQQSLQKVLAFYGNEGDPNGVTVDFGHNKEENGQTITTGKTTEITFNLENIEDTGSYPGTNARTETAATIAHEGQHGIDGQFYGAPINHAERYLTERNAYTTQSYVDEGMNKTSPYNLWHSGWTESPVTNGLRDSAIQINAQHEVYGNQPAPDQ